MINGVGYAKECGKIIPDAITFGLIIQGLQVNNTIDAVKLLEECKNKYNLNIPEKNLRLLRGKLNNLGLKHPDISEDPLLWAKNIKKYRKYKGNKITNSRVQKANSSQFVKK